MQLHFTKILFLALFMILALQLGEDGVEARRGGSSRGARGRYRGGGSRSSRNTYASRVRRTLRSRFFNWKTAAVAGSIYGWHRYSRSPRYHRNEHRRPTICVNLYDYKTDNGTLTEMFICPLYDQGEDYKYCCGPEDRQKCCRFWDKPGNVAGVVIGILLFIAVIGLVIYCVFKNVIKKKDKKEAKYTMTSTEPNTADVTATYPQANAVPSGVAPYPPASGAPPYPPAPQPDGQAYPPALPTNGTAPYPVKAEMGVDDANAMPYPSQAPYPPAPVYTPQGDAGYPAAAPPPYPAN